MHPFLTRTITVAVVAALSGAPALAAAQSTAPLAPAAPTASAPFPWQAADPGAPLAPVAPYAPADTVPVAPPAAPAPIENGPPPTPALPPQLPADAGLPPGPSAAPSGPATPQPNAPSTRVQANPAPGGKGRMPGTTARSDQGAAAQPVLNNNLLPPDGQTHEVHSRLTDAVNHAGLRAHAARHDSNAVLRAQILLDRAHFSPGEISGHFDRNTMEAVRGYQAANGLAVTGRLDAATWRQLVSHDPNPVLEAYTLTGNDVAGPFVPRIPARIDQQAKLPCACYKSPLEELGEKFHISPSLLARYNRGKPFRAGTAILVPVIHVDVPGTRAARVVVTASSKTVAVYDADGHVLAQYPATIGSAHDPLPVGNWKILGVAHHPKYHYNPVHFWDANPNDSKVTVPPGPNNPVGAVWNALSIPHYGIHGTPEPSLIGKTYSHGCIRLTNWDALELSRLVHPGMAALLQQ